MRGDERVIIVGAGLAGLCCAHELHKRGIPFVILEASDAVGGRVRTDSHQGFLLDRGFQIFLTAYPEAARYLDYHKLDFKPFLPGALVISEGKFHKLADPFRHPLEAVSSIFNPVGTIADKLKVALLRQRILESAGKTSKESGCVSTISRLNQFGFTSSIIEKFFRPLFSGIFLEADLETSFTRFDFVFEMLARGDNVLPRDGMQAIPLQIAGSLPEGSIKLLHPVDQVGADWVQLCCGERMSASAVVVATEEPQAKRLLGRSNGASFRSQTCVYYAADKAPIDEPIVVLNGDGVGPITNLVVPSNVAQSYAPSGQSLVSAVAVGESKLSDSQLDEAARNQMRSWFGASVDKWRHLRTYRVKYALPDQTPEALAALECAYRDGRETYCCGDYKETGSINGAMLSGRKAAEAVINDLGYKAQKL